MALIKKRDALCDEGVKKSQYSPEESERTHAG